MNSERGNVARLPSFRVAGMFDDHQSEGGLGQHLGYTSCGKRMPWNAENHTIACLHGGVNRNFCFLKRWRAINVRPPGNELLAKRRWFTAPRARVAIGENTSMFPRGYTGGVAGSRQRGGGTDGVGWWDPTILSQTSLAVDVTASHGIAYTYRFRPTVGYALQLDVGAGKVAEARPLRRRHRTPRQGCR